MECSSLDEGELALFLRKRKRSLYKINLGNNNKIPARVSETYIAASKRTIKALYLTGTQ